MGRRNNKETMSPHNSTTIEPITTEMQGLPEGQFRTLVVEMIQDFRKEFRESLKQMKDQISKESDTQNRNQIEALKEVKEAIIEMKASMQTINNRLEHLESRISLLEDDQSKSEHTIHNIEKTIRQHELDIEEISANLKRANLRIIGIEEGIEAETRGINNLFREVILENFPNIEREVDTPGTRNI